jgi:cell fate (sporulation/competence/biofilm development) regulator YlbF (YheA/YmcA/DUF963 family)
MDIIQQARELGAAIQSDERYTFFRDVKLAMDEDETLQQKIGAFNLERMNMDKMLEAGDSSQDAVKAQSDKIRSLYADILADENMQRYEDAKKAVETLVSQINTIMDVSISGGDPLTCDLTACTHDCSTCGGCG